MCTLVTFKAKKVHEIFDDKEMYALIIVYTDTDTVSVRVPY